VLLLIKHIVPLNFPVPLRRFRPPGFSRGIWNGYLPTGAVPRMAASLADLLRISTQKAQLNAAGQPTRGDTVPRYELLG
jgi:hypothetical protein